MGRKALMWINGILRIAALGGSGRFGNMTIDTDQWPTPLRRCYHQIRRIT